MEAKSSRRPRGWPAGPARPSARGPLSITAILGLGLLLVSSCGPRDEDWFSGKAVTIIVPHATGGMDTYARSFAPYLQKYLSGSKVSVVNVEALGGIEGRNRVYEAPPDGLVLGFTTGAGSILTEWAGQREVGYVTARFSYIGRLCSESHILVVSPRSGIRSFTDILARKRLSMGFPGSSSDDYSIGLVSARLLGIKVDAKTSFRGADETTLACVRGQVEAVLFTESTLRAQIASDTLLPVACFGPVSPALGRSVTDIREFAPAESREFVAALENIYALERVLFGPPGMSPARLAVLRRAFDRAAADPQFARDMAKIKRPLNVLSGAEVEGLIGAVLKEEPEIRPFVAGIGAVER